MNSFLLIGGGEISNSETKELDLEIKKLCQKTNPKILFFPIAAHDSDEYIKTFNKYFTELGFITDYCKISAETEDEIKLKLLWADALYFGGGSAIYALEQLKRINFAELLKCRKRSIVISGISAGAMIWCKKVILSNDEVKFEVVDGLGLISLLFRPHYKKEQEYELRRVLSDSIGYGIEDKSAIVLDGKLRFIGNVSIIEK